MRNHVATSHQSLLSTAFDVLLEQLGPEKTAQLWQMLVPSSTDYLKVRKKLFRDKTLSTLSKEAKKFNRK